jgi:predicted metal-binding membrane protein
MNHTAVFAANTQYVPYIYGALLIIAGVYQFTPLKKTCIGYCESPMSFFLRRWRDGTFGAVKMGLYHGMYCLGCCWAYFLLMVALGWMNLFWMGLFAGIIFGEKIWCRGVLVAKAAGVGFAIAGLLVMSGIFPSLVSSASSTDVADDRGSMTTNMNDDRTDNNEMAMSDNSNPINSRVVAFLNWMAGVPS